MKTTPDPVVHRPRLRRAVEAPLSGQGSVHGSRADAVNARRGDWHLPGHLVGLVLVFRSRPRWLVADPGVCLAMRCGAREYRP